MSKMINAVMSVMKSPSDYKYNETFGQVGQRGGPEEVLEFSKRTAERVKAILDQGQVRQLCGSYSGMHEPLSHSSHDQKKPRWP